MSDGDNKLLQVLGLRPPARLAVPNRNAAPAQCIAESLRDALRRLDRVAGAAGGQAGEGAALVQRANDQLAVLEGDGPADDAALERAVNLVRQLADYRTGLVRRIHADQAAQLKGAADRFVQRTKASGADVPAGTLSDLDELLGTLKKETEFDPDGLTQRTLQARLATLRDLATAGELARDTPNQRLDNLGEARARHAGLKGVADVQVLLGRMIPGHIQPFNGAAPMGEASPNWSGSVFPEVQLVQDAGAFRFKKTQAREAPNHVCTILPIGTIVYGKIGFVEGDDVWVNKDDGTAQPRSFRVPGAQASWGGCTLERRITPQAYAEIELRELEHVIDYSYAFHISAVRLAEAINRLAANSYQDEDKALDAIEAELAGAPALLPENPRDPKAWSARLHKVLAELGGLSKLRDTRRTHSPAGWKGMRRADSVVVEPVFEARSLVTQTIITLDDLEVVYKGRGGAAAAALALGDMLKLRQKFGGLDFCTAVDGEQVDMGPAPPGLEIRIESAPVDGATRVWVSAAPETLGTPKSQYPTQRVFFKLPADGL